MKYNEVKHNKMRQACNYFLVEEREQVLGKEPEQKISTILILQAYCVISDIVLLLLLLSHFSRVQFCVTP